MTEQQLVMPWPATLDPALVLVIPGEPAGQGSMMPTTAGGMRYPTSTVGHRNRVIAELLDAWAGREPLVGPVSVVAELRFRRLGSHVLPANSRRARPEVRPDAPEWQVGTPDADKCARLLGDALEIAGVIVNDKQIARWQIDKRYVPDIGPGATTVALYQL